MTRSAHIQGEVEIITIQAKKVEPKIRGGPRASMLKGKNNSNGGEVDSQMSCARYSTHTKRPH